MANDQSPKKAGTPRWVKILLGLSLALNLLIVGAVAGTFFRVSKSGIAQGPRSGFAFVAALERTDRKALLGEMRQTNRDNREAGRAEIQQILTALRAPAFDAEQVVALMQQQIERGHTVQNTLRSELIATISDMSVDERLAYADRVEAHLTRRSKGKHKGGDR